MHTTSHTRRAATLGRLSRRRPRPWKWLARRPPCSWRPGRGWPASAAALRPPTAYCARPWARRPLQYSAASIARTAATAAAAAGKQPGWIAWQAYAQGEYVGHARLAHVPEYRLRVDDQLDMLYRADPRRDRHALQAERGRRDPRRIVHRRGAQPRPAHPARRHDHAAPAGPGTRHGPHRRRSSATRSRSCTRSITRCRPSPSRR